MSLKLRFLLLTGLLMVISGIGIWMLSQRIVSDVFQDRALRHFETRVMLERERSLQSVIREVVLARQLADSQILKDWARDENNPDKKQLAMAELETFRRNFADQSYFVALLQSGNYYHNNAVNEFAGAELRYQLRSDNPDDRWFYSIIEQNRDIHLNVNPDIPLKVTKLWIDVLLRHDDRILGVVGTGLDLSRFIKQFTVAPEPGVRNMFFDHEGAVQIAADIGEIDFASITKTASEHKTIWQHLGSPDASQLRQAMATSQQLPDTVVRLNLHIEGKQYLAGIIYLPEIEWFVMTLLDIDTLLPLSTFNGIFLLAGLSVFAALGLFQLALTRYVLKPLQQVECGIQQVRQGGPVEAAFNEDVEGEIGRIMSHFRVMATEVLESRERLEARVQQRTEELERLSLTDPVTGLLNRRGMMRRLESERLKDGNLFGILWMDLDFFKNINDRFGHAAGDQALEATAWLIRANLGDAYHACRWGGDEFLILVATSCQDTLDGLGERLCQQVRNLDLQTIQGDLLRVTLSVGGYMVQAGDSLNEMLARADQALYQAKEGGRDRYCSGNRVGRTALYEGNRR